MKKILIVCMAFCGLLLTACTKESLKGETWFKTRVDELIPEHPLYGLAYDSLELEMAFTESAAGEQRYQSYRIFRPDAYRDYDSVRVLQDATIGFEYEYSNGTGIMRYKDGRVWEFNVRDDKLIVQGSTFVSKR